MKVLDVKSLQSGIDVTKKDIEAKREQIETLQKAVHSFHTLDEGFKGQGGKAIRSFYRDMHEPFLVHLHQSFIDYGDVLNEMKEAVESFESNENGYVSQAYVEDDVVEGFDKVDSQVTELTDDANSIIENVEDLVSIKAIDASVVHEDVEVGKDRAKDLIDKLHSLDQLQAQALQPILDQITNMKQYLTNLGTMFSEGGVPIDRYDPSVMKIAAPGDTEETKQLKEYLSGYEDGDQDSEYPLSNFSPPDSDDYGEITYWDKRKVMGGNSPLAGTPDGLAGPAAFTFNVGMGAGKGAYDFTADTVKGLWNTVAHPIDTASSIVHAVTHPMDTYNIFKDAIQTSYQRDMVDGDAESRTRWLTYAGGTIVTSVLGTKGADKVSKVGTTAAKSTVAPSKAALNNINRRIPNLFPLGPKYELAPVGTVPYNVIDSGNLKDQMIRFSKHFTDHTKTKLKPNITYRAGEYNYLYKTDQFGRIKEFSTDNLQLTTRDVRLRHNPHTLGKQPGDHAGHIAGDRFGGSPDLDNLVSQLSGVNLSRYKIIENDWAKAIKAGNKVEVEVNIQYKGCNVRPSGFEVEYKIDGMDFIEIIPN